MLSRRDRDAESACRGHAVDGRDEGFRRPPDLRDGAVDVFEDLLETFTVPAAHRAGRQIAGIAALAPITTIADELEIGAAAEHRRQSAQHDDTNAGITGTL